VPEEQFKRTSNGALKAGIKELPSPTGKAQLNLSITTFVDHVDVRTHTGKILRSAGQTAIAPDRRSVSVDNLHPSQSRELVLTSTEGDDKETVRSISVQALEANTVAAATTVAYQYANAAQYQTFISVQYVPMGLMENVGCSEAYAMGGRYFGGDNRTFRAPPAASPEWDTDGRYRSMQFAVVNWDNPDGYRMVVIKNVGTTRVYNGSKQLISTRRASDAKVQFLEAASSSTYAQVRFSAVVGDPYCNLGAVRYNVINRMYRSGLIETVGWKNQSPHHEVYGRFSNSLGADYWKTIGQWANTGFYCLVEPACANVTVSKSARAS
jgi:hypothetical protein